MLRRIPLNKLCRRSKLLSFTKRLNHYDSIILGGGHNGLTCAAYLAMAKQKVIVLEKRHLVGGAAVSEEIVPGFKFSRFSYLCSLFRKEIIQQLQLEKHGLKLIERNPSSFTPTKKGDYLLMGPDDKLNFEQISKFSKRDAQNYAKYEQMLTKFVKILDPLLDVPPIEAGSLWKQRDSLSVLIKQATKLGFDAAEFAEILAAPADKILKRWFESEPLLSTLATDSIIGAMVSPSVPGSSYVLLHHVMGDSGAREGCWSYVKGGMGALSESIASAAREHGAEIKTNAAVKRVLIKDGQAYGVVLEDGTEILGKRVISNCDPYTTYLKLVDPEEKILDKDFIKSMKAYDYTSPVFKINLAVNKLPNFLAKPNDGDTPGPQHYGIKNMI